MSFLNRAIDFDGHSFFAEMRCGDTVHFIGNHEWNGGRIRRCLGLPGGPWVTFVTSSCQDRALLVRLELADGRKIYEIATVPDRDAPPQIDILVRHR